MRQIFNIYSMRKDAKQLYITKSFSTEFTLRLHQRKQTGRRYVTGRAQSAGPVEVGELQSGVN